MSSVSLSTPLLIRRILVLQGLLPEIRRQRETGKRVEGCGDCPGLEQASGQQLWHHELMAQQELQELCTELRKRGQEVPCMEA